jgi:Mrp family chromosome partitioning ATPase
LFRRPSDRPLHDTEPAAPLPAAAPAYDAEAASKQAWASLRVASPNLRRSVSGIAPQICQDRGDPVSQNFDLLRTRLLQKLAENGWSRVAVAAPTPGCGSTFTACNLATSISRIAAFQTVLVDLNLRSPGVGKAFGLDGGADTRKFLTGQTPLASFLVRYCDNLALGVPAGAETAAAELLHDPRTGATLANLHELLRPNVMLIDVPPILAHDDALAILPHVDGVLIAADSTQTTAKEIAECVRVISDQTPLLGVVLNKAPGNSGAGNKR